MTFADDETTEVRTLDRILSGLVDPEDAPPELREVARLVRVAQGPASEAELSNAALFATEIAAVVRRSTAPAVSPRWRGRVAKVVSAKVIALAVALVLGGGVAAAATGSLPAPIQRVVSDGLHHIGIAVPRPSSQRQIGPSRPGSQARAGLCQAYREAASHASALPAASLAELKLLADQAGESLAAYCEPALLHPAATAVSASRSHRPSKPASRAHGSAPAKTGHPASSRSHGRSHGGGGPVTSGPPTAGGRKQGTTSPGHGSNEGKAHRHHGSLPVTSHTHGTAPSQGKRHDHKGGSGKGPTPTTTTEPITTTTTTTLVHGNGGGSPGSGDGGRGRSGRPGRKGTRAAASRPLGLASCKSGAVFIAARGQSSCVSVGKEAQQI